jgi:hypothetical protein
MMAHARPIYSRETGRILVKIRAHFEDVASLSLLIFLEWKKILPETTSFV